MSEATVQEKLLVLLLRLGGALLLLAFPAMLLPTGWMAATHAWLGLGEFPETTIVDYLTRSISALYGVHGGLLLLVSGDVRRYRAVIRYVALMNLMLGVALLVIDIAAGMPWFWTLGEGPPIFALGVVMLVLLRSVPTER